MKFRRRFQIKSGIDLTPMIDVVFNLLIFFLIGSTIIDNPKIEINLPKSSSAEESSNTENIVVSISKDEKVYVNGEEANEIDTFFQELSKNSTDRVIEIRADEEVKTQILISVIDSIKNAGFNKISIATLSK